MFHGQRPTDAHTIDVIFIDQLGKAFVNPAWLKHHESSILLFISVHLTIASTAPGHGTTIPFLFASFLFVTHRH
jgi:hypothetical protein